MSDTASAVQLALVDVGVPDSDDAKDFSGPSNAERPTLCNIPVELFLEIASFLDVTDVLSIRQTCQKIALLTTHKSTWVHLLQQQRQQLPIACFEDIAALSSQDTESLVRSTLHIEHTWLLQRPTLLTAIAQPSAGTSTDTDAAPRTILSMEVFCDRWLLCIYCEGLVELWDLDPLPLTARTADPPSSAVCCISYGVGAMCTSSVVCLDADMASLILAITSQCACRFLRMIFPVGAGLTRSDARIESIAELYIPTPLYLIRAIHLDSNLAVFSLSSSLRLVNWNTCERWTVYTNAEEDELWNGIIGARMLTSHHILCMKVHTIELYTLPALPRTPPHAIPDDRPVHADVLVHPFLRTTFRGVSFSRAPPAPDMALAFLAFDVLRGLFHFRLALHLPTAAPADMAVRLLAAHQMAVPVGAAEVPRVPRGGLSAGARGFVSACVLGPAGRRGVWVERRRGSMRRDVVGFRLANGEEDLPEVEEDAEGAQWEEGPHAAPIEGRTVYEINSYDLRDDITHCAFAEATGRIVLGTRDGRIQVL